MRWRFLPVALFAGACSPPPYVVLTVRNGDGVPDSAPALALGPELDRLERHQEDLTFPANIVLTADEAGIERLLWVEALDGAGAVVGRGRALVELPASGEGAAEVVLAPPCLTGGAPWQGCALADASGNTGVCSAGACANSRCGDAFVDSLNDELCDDGNTDDGDACLIICRPNVCGDGIELADPLDPNVEECDDGNSSNEDGCLVGCIANVCGDGFVWRGVEACDDGNTNLNDGCDAGVSQPLCRPTAWVAAPLFGSGSGGEPSLRINPTGLAVDSDGRLYIADARVTPVNERPHVVWRYDPSLTGARVIAGGGKGQGDGPATDVALQYPTGLAVDGQHNVYMMDTYRLRRVDARTGEMRVIVGQDPGGNPQSIDDVAVATDGSVYYADAGVLMRYDPASSSARQVFTLGDSAAPAAGVLLGNVVLGFELVAVARNKMFFFWSNISYGPEGVFEVDFDAANAGKSRIVDRIGSVPSDVIDLAADDAGNLYAARTRTVLRVAPGGSTDEVFNLDAPEVPGPTGLDDEISAPPPATTEVKAIAAASAELYVATSDRIYAVDYLTRTVTTTLSLRAPADGTAATASPVVPAGSGAFISALAPGVGGELLFAREGVVLARDPLLATTRAIAGRPNPERASSVADNVPAQAAVLSSVAGVAMDSAGRMFISDYDDVYWVDTIGDVHLLALTYIDPMGASVPVANPSGLRVHGNDLYVASAGTGVARLDLSVPLSSAPADMFTNCVGDRVAVAPNGTALFTADYNGTVCRLDLPGGGNPQNLGAFGASDVAALSENEVYAVRSGTSFGSTFNELLKIEWNTLTSAWDATQLFYLLFSENDPATIPSLNDGRPLGVDAGEAALLYPDTILADGPDTLYVGCNGPSPRIRRLVRRPDGNFDVDSIAGGFDAEGDGAGAVARLSAPQGIAALGGRFLVADSDRLRWLDMAQSRVASVVGVAGGSTVTLVPSPARWIRALAQPGALVYDGAGRAYVSERSGHTVLAVDIVDPADPATWVASRLAGQDGSPRQLNGFNAPVGLALDAAGGVLYVADSGNHVVRAVDLATGAISTVAGTLGVQGTPNPDPTTSETANSTHLDAPTVLALALTGELYIAQTSTHRVYRVVPSGGSMAEGVISLVLGDGTPSSAGEGAPAERFSVDTPRGMVVDRYGNLFATSRTSVRRVSDAGGPASGAGTVTTVYATSPASCLAGLSLDPGDATDGTLLILDACEGALVRLSRQTQ